MLSIFFLSPVCPFGHLQLIWKWSWFSSRLISSKRATEFVSERLVSNDLYRVPLQLLSQSCPFVLPGSAVPSKPTLPAPPPYIHCTSSCLQEQTVLDPIPHPCFLMAPKCVAVPEPWPLSIFLNLSRDSWQTTACWPWLMNEPVCKSAEWVPRLISQLYLPWPPQSLLFSPNISDTSTTIPLSQAIECPLDAPLRRTFLLPISPLFFKCCCFS